MEGTVVRLASLTLEHIKNVKSGTIVMPSAGDADYRKMTVAEILGIYGQNGSGKTAIVDALYYLQQIMIGQKLEQSIFDYIDVDEVSAEIVAEFSIHQDNALYEVGYHISLARNDGEINIAREYLNCSIQKDGNRTNKIIFMDYQQKEPDPVFKPVKRLEELIGKDKEIKTDLIVARKMAEKSNCSYIFGDSSREIILKNQNEEFKIFSNIISALFEFALKDLFVIRNTHSGMITANFILPMAFRVEKELMGVK